MNEIELFNQLPHIYLLIGVDAPKFTILQATDMHLETLNLKREYVIGKGFFELFPDNPEQSYKNSVKLTHSFLHVIEKSEEHHMRNVQYDVADKNGIFETMFWNVHNHPFFINGEVVAIINNPVNLTSLFKQV